MKESNELLPASIDKEVVVVEISPEIPTLESDSNERAKWKKSKSLTSRDIAITSSYIYMVKTVSLVAPIKKKDVKRNQESQAIAFYNQKKFTHAMSLITKRTPSLFSLL